MQLNFPTNCNFPVQPTGMRYDLEGGRQEENQHEEEAIVGTTESTVYLRWTVFCPKSPRQVQAT